MFKKLSHALILTTTLSAEPITPDNVESYRCSNWLMNLMGESNITNYRGGISRDVDLVTSKEIIKNLLRDYRGTVVLENSIADAE